MGETASLVERLKASRPYTAWKRYGDANGDLLAAGVAYYAFFSVFPALALAFVVFGFVLQGRPDLVDAIAEYLNGILPGMVRTADNPAGVIGLAAPQTSTLTITSIVSLATLLLSGVGWVGALRTGIRAVLGLAASPGNMVTTKVRDLALLFTVGVGVALSAVLTGVVGGLATHLAGWVGLAAGEWFVTVVGLALGVAVDTALLALVLRILSGMPLPWSRLRSAAVIGAVALTVLKYFGGLLIARATGNPLLGAVAVAVGLLFWLDLMSKVTLLSAAWVTIDGTVRELTPREAGHPETPTLPPSAPYAAHPAPMVTSSRAVDRLSVTAGAVLGAAGALLALSLRRLREGSSSR